MHSIKCRLSVETPFFSFIAKQVNPIFDIKAGMTTSKTSIFSNVMTERHTERHTSRQKDELFGH